MGKRRLDETGQRIINYRFPKVRVTLVKETNFQFDAPQILCPADAVRVAAQVLQDNYGSDQKESLWCIYLNTQNRVTGIEAVATGTGNSCGVCMADLFRGALVAGAESIIMAHNHPSGNLSPSPEDISLTRRVIDGAKLINLAVLDHVIFNDETYYSLKEHTSLLF